MAEGENISNVDVVSTSDGTTTTTTATAVREGISKMVASLIRNFDSKAQDASLSQLHLSSALDRLTSQLDQLLEDAPLPFIMQHATKLSNVRKRVESLNSLLKSVQHRLDNVDRIISIASLDKSQTPEALINFVVLVQKGSLEHAHT